MRFVALALAVGLACAGPQLALADEGARPPVLGRTGDVVISADRLVPLLGYTRQSTTASQGLVETTTTDSGASFAVFVGREPGLASMHTVPRLAADFFVLNKLSIGTALPIAFGLAGARVEERSGPGGGTSRRTDSPRTTILGFAPRAGYLVSLGDTLSVWTRVGFAFYSVSETSEQATEASGVARTTDRATSFSLDLDPQIVWSPVPRWFVNAGLLACIPLIGARSSELEQGGASSTRTDDLSVFRVGLSAGLGGWLSL